MVVRNRSQSRWPAAGATRVRIGHRWREVEGGPVLAEGERAELGDQHVAPDREVRAALRIRAPEVAGTYLLELDLVRERVRWFSAADDANVYRLQIEVVDPP